MANKKLDAHQIKKLKMEYYQGVNVPQLAEMFNISTQSVYNYLKGGPKRKHRRLTSDDVLRIMAEPSDKSVRQIAENYPVSYETIRKIRKGE